MLHVAAGYAIQNIPEHSRRKLGVWPNVLYPSEEIVWGRPWLWRGSVGTGDKDGILQELFKQTWLSGGFLCISDFVVPL